MTVLFERVVEGAATHAFVVGVGNFPYAADGRVEYLRDVPNLPSAADSAKMMCDWLLENRDTLVAPLASLEVLISDPPDAKNRYPWEPGLEIDKAASAKVEEAGDRWLERFPKGSKNTAFFYGCGHGASLSADPALFLEDLNRRPAKPWPYIHVGNLAKALRFHPEIDAAYVFLDACAQKVAEFELTPSDNRAPAVFYVPEPYYAVAGVKVMLTTAAPEGQLAYDAPLSERYHQPPLAGVPIARFTQILLMALNGSSVRQYRNKWAVDSAGLQKDLKKLKQFYFPNLVDYPFEPVPIYGFNEDRPFVFPKRPIVPFSVMTDPLDRISQYEFCIRETEPQSTPTGGGMKHDVMRKAWFGEIPPRNTSVYAVAFDAEKFFTYPFNPDQPRFDVQIYLS